MIQIKNWRTGAVIFEGEYQSIKDAVEAAVKQGVSLAWANLAYEDFTDAILIGAILTRANLIGANLIGADLTDAILIGANLTWADLTRAILIRAILYGADLTDAIVTGTILDTKK